MDWRAILGDAMKRAGALGGGDDGTVSAKFIAVMNERNALRRLDGIDQKQIHTQRGKEERK
jgi:hypothetical protein